MELTRFGVFRRESRSRADATPACASDALVPDFETTRAVLRGPRRLGTRGKAGARYLASMGESIRLVNPATGEDAREVACDSAAELEAKIERAREAQRRWRQRPVRERVALVASAMEPFRAQRETIARDVSLEMGKPIAQARGEVDTLLARTKYMLGIAERELAPEHLPAKEG